MKLKLRNLLFVLVFSFSITSFSQDFYLGEIRMFAGNFAPNGWAFCNGQILQISQYSALYSLLGTMYGGDGVNTFALPDLRGRVPMGVGSGPGLTTRAQGITVGSETNTLTVLNLPSHSHDINASDQAGTTSDPKDAVPAHTNTFDKEYNTSPNVTMSSGMVGNTGSNSPVNNIQPSTTVQFIIATSGIYPTQN